MRRPTCFRRNVLDNPDSRARSTTCDAARLFGAGADPYSETGRVRPVEKQGRSSRAVTVRRTAVTAGYPDPAVATIGNSHNCAGSAVRYQTGCRYPRVAVEALPPSDQPRTPALPSHKGKLPWPARTDMSRPTTERGPLRGALSPTTAYSAENRPPPTLPPRPRMPADPGVDPKKIAPQRQEPRPPYATPPIHHRARENRAAAPRPRRPPPPARAAQLPRRPPH